MTPPVGAWVHDLLPVLPAVPVSLYDSQSPGSDSPSDDIDYQTNFAALSCAFAPATDPESGIVDSRLCWSSVPTTACDVWPWVDFGNVSSRGAGVNKTALGYNVTVTLAKPLPLLSRVYCVVMHENGAGDTIVIVSDGVQMGKVFGLVLFVNVCVNVLMIVVRNGSLQPCKCFEGPLSHGYPSHVVVWCS